MSARALALGSAVRLGALAPVVAVVACALWSGYVLGEPAGWSSTAPRGADELLYGVPCTLAVLALLSRGAMPRVALGVLAYTGCVALAVLSIGVALDDPLISMAPAGLVALALVVARLPTLAMGFVLLSAGIQFSVKALTGVPMAPVADAAIAGGWAALVWGFATGSRALPARLPLSFGLLGAYIAVSLLSALLMENLTQGMYGFRMVGWYMGVAILVALLFRGEAGRLWLRRILLGVILVVAAYAAFRWVVGPAEAESAIVSQSGAYAENDLGELRVFGSQPGPTALGVWCAFVTPIALAFSLAPLPPIERLLGLLGAVVSFAVLAGTDIRTGIVGTVVGCGVVLLVAAAARGLGDRRLIPLIVALFAIVPAGGIFAAVELSDTGSGGVRFRGLFDPLNDESIQGRLVKWKTIVADVRGHPFGHGVGATGSAEQRYARYRTSATFSPDSGYVKVIYEQGWAVLVLFVATLLSVFATVLRAAVRARSPGDAATAVAAAGAMASFIVFLLAGSYQEGQSLVLLWALVGLAVAPLIARAPADREAQA